MEQIYAITIFLTIVGFAGLAAAALIPVHRFLNREQQKADAWNEAIRRHREEAGGPPVEAPTGTPADG